MIAKPQAPPANAFSHRFVVSAADIDELGHAGNVRWVQWVQDAASAHSLAVGLGLPEYQAFGLLWVVRRHDIEYLGPAYANEALEALTWIESVKAATTVRRTLFRRVSDGAPLARAATTWVLIKADTGRPTRIPPELEGRYGFTR